ncbi:MAG: AMIN domain-containing protein [Polyangia bacterium]
MRLLSVVLGLSLAATAHAQSEDDEKPGDRTKAAPNRQAPARPSGETPVEAAPNTQAPLLTDPPAPAYELDKGASAPPAAHGTGGATEERYLGDSPLQLQRRRPTGAVQGSHTEGTYTGVSLDGQGTPPRASKRPVKKGFQRLTWPGFQVRDGMPTVFLQTTGTPDYTVTQTPGALLVTLHGTTISLRNNSRPLKVAAFGTDVSEVSAKAHGKDVVVTIRRTGTAHRERVEASAGGYQILVIELPQQP